MTADETIHAEALADTSYPPYRALRAAAIAMSTLHVPTAIDEKNVNLTLLDCTFVHGTRAVRADGIEMRGVDLHLERVLNCIRTLQLHRYGIPFVSDGELDTYRINVLHTDGYTYSVYLTATCGRGQTFDEK